MAKFSRVFAAFILIMLSLFSPALAENNKIKTQVLMQVGNIRGKYMLYIAKDAIRLEGVISQMVTIAKGPKWTVLTFDKSINQYSETPFAEYKGNEMKSILLFYGVDLAEFDWRSVGTEKIAGIEALHLMPVKRRNVSKAELKLAARCRGLWVAKDTEYPKPIARIVSRLYALPTDDRMPLKFVFDADDQKLNGLITITNQTKLVPESLFSLPAGAKKVDKLVVPHPEGLL